MLPRYVDDAKFWQLLHSIDQDLAAQARAEGCSYCGAPLHAAHYPRKPRGPARTLLGERGSQRLSWCCSRDGCRRRHTPVSVRFLARRVYVGVWVVLVSALTHGMSARRVSTLRGELGVDERTVRRWRSWWLNTLPSGRWWHQARGAFMPPVAEAYLPGSLLERFGALEAPSSVLRTLQFLASLSADTPVHAG